jgi:hypothetical protein
MMGVVACVTSGTRVYVPVVDAQRIPNRELRERVNDLVSIECPRLLRGRPLAYGTADLTLLVDAAGLVRQARLERGSGDAAVDDIVGGLAAQLAFVRPGAGHTDPRSHHLTIAYSCAPSTSFVRVELEER